MSEAEMKIAEWVWANPGIGSMKIVHLCEANYGWKQSTVYTMIRRMREKGVLVNENASLRMTVDRDTYYRTYAEEFVKNYYQNSLYMFLDAYTKNVSVKRQDAGRLINLIRNRTEEL